MVFLHLRDKYSYFFKDSYTFRLFLFLHYVFLAIFVTLKIIEER